MLKGKDILVFDFETTGLSATNDEIIEIGAVKYTLVNGKYQITDELQEILKTNVLISEKITEITGIDQKMQDELGISQEEGFKKLSSLIDPDTLLIAYNIQFDLGFLTEFYHKHQDTNFYVKNDLLDIMAVYKDRNGWSASPVEGWRLESALKKYSVDLPNSHRALDDVKATYGVMKELAREKGNLGIYINVVGIHPKYAMNGPKLPHVTYVPQYGGKLEIERK